MEITRRVGRFWLVNTNIPILAYFPDMDVIGVSFGTQNSIQGFQKLNKLIKENDFLAECIADPNGSLKILL